MGSNSLAFKTWLKDEGPYVVHDLKDFNGTRIAIDAEDYLHSILQPGHQAPEPLLPAHGGNGFTIKKRVDEDLARFRDAGIEPWFIFNGLDVACRDRANILNESRKAAKDLDAAWAIYDSGDGERAVQSFGKACTYRTYHILRSLFFHLHRQGVYVQIAPFTAAAHLAYLAESGYVNGVQGTVSCLLYGAEQFITEFDWANNRVAFTTEEKCLAMLGLNREQFACVCLISGCSIMPGLPELDRDDVKSKIPAATAMLKSFGGDIDALLRSKGRAYQEDWYRAHFALKHPLIMDKKGTVRPRDWEENEKAPSDYTNFVGHNLPAELFQYLSRGLIGPRPINWRTKHELLETQPLDGGSSSSYRDLVSTKLRPIRAQTIGLLTSILHRYFQSKDVNLVCWFNDSQETNLNIKGTSNWQNNADTWHVESDQRPKAGQSVILGSGLMYAITSLSGDADAKKTLTPRVKDAPPPLEDFEHVRSNIVWRFLHDTGYVNDDHTLTSWGRVLKAANDRAARDGNMATEESKAEMEEALFIAIELLRLDLLGTQQMFQSPPYSGGLSRGNDIDKNNAMLISRIACLGNVEHDKIGYTGPLSRSLLAYHQMTTAVRGALRDLMEMHAGYIFLSASVKRHWQNSQYTNLAARLPFVEEPDLALGLVVKSYLDELSAPPPTRADVKSWFIHVHGLDRNLQKAWSIWDAINAGVQAGDGSIVKSDIKTTFKNADAWLHAKLEKAKEVPNGTNGTS